MSKSTLCWKCNKTGGGCSWSRSFQPVKGWTAKKAKIKNPDGIIDSFLVIDCPHFQPLSVYKNGLDINKIEFYKKFKQYSTFYTKEEQMLVETYLQKTVKEMSIYLQINQRTIFRKLKKIKDKLEKMDKNMQMSEI